MIVNEAGTIVSFMIVT